jgi:hypothetical protein
LSPAATRQKKVDDEAVKKKREKKDLDDTAKSAFLDQMKRGKQHKKCI